MKILRAILTDIERLGQAQVAIRVSPQADANILTTLRAIPGLQEVSTSASGLMMVAQITADSITSLENVAGVVVMRHVNFS